MRSVDRSRAQPNDFARELFNGLPHRYDTLAELLSFGQNRRWRRAMVQAITPSAPRRVLDVATGTAGVALMLTDHTDADVVGIDLSEQMLRRGRDRVRQGRQERRIRLVVGRGEQLPFADNAFDALTFTYLLRYVSDPAVTVAELARVVRPGGTIASLEFAVPPHPLWRFGWRLYTRALLPVAGLLAGGAEWAKVGAFLGPSIEQHYRAFPLQAHVDAWHAARLESVHTRSMSLGGGLVMWGRRGDG
jgi:demethylmenaquinone methyltransferase / 2-methoxy-6-polyprenyl-1,4-benzoquinol methylase